MKSPRSKISRRQIVIVALLVVFFFMMMDLNGRLSVLSRLSGQRDVNETQYVQLLVTKSALETRIAYATSEAAVEDYARDKAHLSQPGDIVIVPLPGENVSPTQAAVEQPTLQPVTNIEVWKALILGE